MEEQKYIQSINMVKSLGFYPKNDLFIINLFDVDTLRLHVMDCLGALICFEKKLNKLQNNAVVAAKWRVFWQSLIQVASFAENDLLQTNAALTTVLQSFPDKRKVIDGRSWLPLHFAVLLEKSNPADINAILISNRESIDTGSDSRLINPCHLFSMSSSVNPNLMVLQQLKFHNSRMGKSITSDGNTRLCILQHFIPTVSHL